MSFVELDAAPAAEDASGPGDAEARQKESRCVRTCVCVIWRWSCLRRWSFFGVAHERKNTDDRRLYPLLFCSEKQTIVYDTPLLLLLLLPRLAGMEMVEACV